MDSNPARRPAFAAARPVLVFLLAVSAIACGNTSTAAPASANGEPPADFGMVPSSTQLQGMSGDEVSYDVVYPRGSTSVAILGLDSKALHSETYLGSWKIVFAYDDKNPEKFQVPASFQIYGASGSGAYDRLINTYEFSGLTTEAGESCAAYKDKTGNPRVIHMGYLLLLGSS
jgi:hypothetical protein